MEKILIKRLLCLSITFNILLIGGIMNLYTSNSNGGRMPVYYDITYESEKHFTFQDFESVKLPYLGDIFEFETDKWIINYSIGDVFLICGLILHLFFSVLYIRDSYRLKKNGNKNLRGV